MTKRRNADLFEVLIGEIRQDDKIDVILGKALRVLPETEFFKPVRSLLHRGHLTPARVRNRASGQGYGEFSRHHAAKFDRRDLR